MGKLQKQLDRWQSNGLITEDQSEQIMAFEGRSGRKTQWILYGFIILGVFVLGIGAISIIASNWDRIPGMAKLAVDFLVLISLAGAILRYSKSANQIVFDGLAALFILLCLASIGLISQVYHTGGELYQALFLWSLITLPVTLLGNRGFLYYLWVAGFVTLLFTWTLTPSSFWYDHFQLGDEDNVISVFVLVPFALFAVVQLCGLWSKLDKLNSALTVWSILLGLELIAVTDGFASINSAQVSPESMLPVYLCGTTGMVLMFVRSAYSAKNGCSWRS